MSIEANKAIIRRWFDEFWNAEKLEVADENQIDFVSLLKQIGARIAAGAARPGAPSRAYGSAAGR